MIAGLYPANGGVLTGAVRLFGKEVKELRPKERARTLTMMFQNPDLQFCMDTLRKELQFCMGNLEVPQEEMEERLQCAAKILGMEEKLDQKLINRLYTYEYEDEEQMLDRLEPCMRDISEELAEAYSYMRQYHLYILNHNIFQ